MIFEQCRPATLKVLLMAVQGINGHHQAGPVGMVGMPFANEVAVDFIGDEHDIVGETNLGKLRQFGWRPRSATGLWATEDKEFVGWVFGFFFKVGKVDGVVAVGINQGVVDKCAFVACNHPCEGGQPDVG